MLYKTYFFSFYTSNLNQCVTWQFFFFFFFNNGLLNLARASASLASLHRKEAGISSSFLSASKLPFKPLALKAGIYELCKVNNFP